MIPGITASIFASATVVHGGYNQLDKSAALALSDGNTTVTKTEDDSEYSTIRSVQGWASGCWYLEHKINADNGEIYIGVCTDAMTFGGFDSIGGGGSGDQGVGYVPMWGWISPGDHPVIRDLDTAEPNDVIGCAVDLDSGLIWFRVNDGDWNGDPSYSPATRNGGYPFRYDFGEYLPIGGTLWHAAVSMWEDGNSVTSNFGEAAFAHAAPSGFQPWATGLHVGSVIVDSLTHYNQLNTMQSGWPDASIAALDNNSAESVASGTKTFTAMDIGEPSSDRQVLLLLAKNGTSETIDSVTIRPDGDAGLEKTCVVTEVYSVGSGRLYFAAAHVPDEYETADVTVTFSGSGTKDLFCQSYKSTGLQFLHPHPYFGLAATNNSYSGFNFVSTGSPYQVADPQKRGGIVISFGVFGDDLSTSNFTQSGMESLYGFSAAQGGFKMWAEVRGPLGASAAHSTAWSGDTPVDYLQAHLLLR